MKTSTHESVPPLARQASYWDKWNAETREKKINPESERQSQVVRGWIDALNRKDLQILDVGCGCGWMSKELSFYGSVTGLDLSPGMIERAAQRYPHIHFIAGSITDCELPAGSFDVIVTLEVLSHVADQPEFMLRCAELLKPGGLLLLSTQNRVVYQRMGDVKPPAADQIRNWVDGRSLKQLALHDFQLLALQSVCPRGNLGFLRFVNSTKLNRLLARLLGEGRVQAIKERWLLGSTLMLKAQKPV